MKNNNSNKSNSAYRVFETLKFLIEKPASVSEIITHLEKLEESQKSDKIVYSNSVIYKYLATLKFAGIKLERNKCKYEVKELPFKVDIGEESVQALAILYDLLKTTPSKKIQNDLRNLFYQIEMRYPISNRNIEKQHLSSIKTNVKLSQPTAQDIEKIRQYEKYCEDAVRLQLKYKNLSGEENIITCDPIEVKYIDNNIIFICFNINLNEFLEVNDKQVINMVQLPQCCTKKYFASTTVFELTGRLAKVYTLRNEEYTINSRNNDITTVVSQKESKEQLYRRLMRYDIYCKVISSQRDKLAMKQLIDRTLKNYEGT